jgi:hypothetical protein
MGAAQPDNLNWSPPMAEVNALVAELRRAVARGEDGCGTLPAKEAVKVRPSDWHRITDLARQAADLLALQAAREEALTWIWDDARKIQTALTAAEAENARLREALDDARQESAYLHSLVGRATEMVPASQTLWHDNAAAALSTAAEKEG